MKTEIHVGLDKVRFTYIVPKTKMHIFNATLQYIHFAKHIYPNACQSWKTKYYTQTRVYFNADDYLYVQAGTNHGNLYIAVEFNAANLTNDKWERLHIELSVFLPDGYYTLFYEGKVSFIEIAVDVKYAEFNQTKLIDYRLLTLSTDYKKEGTLYLGSENGARGIKAYDKAKQVKDVKNITLGYPLLRIEAKVRPESMCPQNLASLKNPFTSLFVFNEESTQTCAYKGKVWSSLKHNIFTLDIEPQEAYLGLPKGAHLAVHTPLIYSRLSWWDTNKIWAQALEVLNAMNPQLDYFPTLGWDV